jgi:hypothetical protein
MERGTHESGLEAVRLEGCVEEIGENGMLRREILSHRQKELSPKLEKINEDLLLVLCASAQGCSQSLRGCADHWLLFFGCRGGLRISQAWLFFTTSGNITTH